MRAGRIVLNALAHWRLNQVAQTHLEAMATLGVLIQTEPHIHAHMRAWTHKNTTPQSAAPQHKKAQHRKHNASTNINTHACQHAHSRTHKDTRNQHRTIGA